MSEQLREVVREMRERKFYDLFDYAPQVKEWIDRLESLLPAQPAAGVAVVPEGWRLIRVNGEWDSLCYWLDRNARNDNLPGGLSESWDNFDYHGHPTANQADAEDGELARAWRNQYVSLRTFQFQIEEGLEYENARAHAEAAVNNFDDAFRAARARLAARAQSDGRSGGES